MADKRKARSLNAGVTGGSKKDHAPQPSSDSFAKLYPFFGSTWFALLCTLLVVFLLYLPVRGFDYSIIDDSINVYANRFICEPGAQNIAYLWRHTYYELYMPVTYTIWALFARIAPLTVPISVTSDGVPTVVNPYVMHAANLIFHVANTCLVFAILRRLRFAAWGSAAGALLFGAHPIQVDSVAWVTGLNNLTSGFFSFLAILLYLQQAPTEEGSRPKSRLYSGICLMLSTLSFVAALLSKPTSVCLPLFIVVFEVVVFRRPPRRWAAPVAVWTVLSCACVLITRLASNADSSLNPFWSPLWSRPFLVGDALAFYLVKLFLPYSLANDYARSPQTILHAWWGYVDWLLPAVVFACLFLRLPKRIARLQNIGELRRWLQVAALLLVAGVLPTSGIVPYYSEPISNVNNRYLYLAMLGPAVGVAFLVSQRASKLRLERIIPVVMIAAYAYLTTQQIPVWRNMYSQTNDLLGETPNSAFAHEDYGVVLGNKGNWAAAYQEFQIAKRRYAEQHVVSHETDDAIGKALFHLHRYDESIASYENAIRLWPDDNEAWFQLWFIFSKLHRYGEAEAFVRSRIAAYPDDDRAKFTLGLILMQENRPADALPYVELAATSSPDSADNQYYVGVVLQRLGRYDEAEAYYHKALDADPKNPDATAALAGIQRILGH